MRLKKRVDFLEESLSQLTDQVIKLNHSTETKITKVNPCQVYPEYAVNKGWTVTIDYGSGYSDKGTIPINEALQLLLDHLGLELKEQAGTELVDKKPKAKK